jgi:type I restriction enzyme S subunit
MLEATISQHIAYVQPKSVKASVGWVRRVIDANYKLLRDESEAGGSTKGAITCEQISALKVPLPPPLEQVAIVAFLDRVLGNIDALTAEAQRAIDLLQERRATLISAAVTGQIDVRGIADRVAA